MDMNKNECLNYLSELILEYGQLGIEVGALLARNTYSVADRQTLEDKCDVCHAKISSLIEELRRM
jgi:hypothetical protein